MSKQLQQPHPHLWKFIEYIEDEDTITTSRFYKLTAGVLRERGRNAVDVERDLKIATSKLKLASKDPEFTIMHYLDAVEECTHDYSA